MPTKYVALISENGSISASSYSAPEGKDLNIPYDDYAEVIEITEEEFHARYLKKVSGKIKKDKTKIDEIQAVKDKFQDMSDRIENEQSVTDAEYKWYKKHGGL